MTHIIYGTTLILGSIYANNKYIIYLILFIMSTAKIAVCYIGDCPYHGDSDRVSYGAGGENNTIFNDNVLYFCCFLVIIYRFRNKIMLTTNKNEIENRSMARRYAQSAPSLSPLCTRAPASRPSRQSRR